jgi:DNA-binding NarL/FixJ family response regulator
MQKRRVVLLSDQNLLGEILEEILQNSDEVEYIGTWGLDDLDIARFAEISPGVLVIADETSPSSRVNHHLASIQSGYPDIPIIRVTLEQNDLRVYTSQSKPARRAELIDLIRQLSGESQVDLVSEGFLEEDGGEANAN